MKTFTVTLVCIALILSCTACYGMSISTATYDEIADYVLGNFKTIPTEKDIEFFDYESTGLSVGGVYYGYYYTANNEIAVPDFYSGNNLGERYEADGGTYFGKPNNGTDWCYIKAITNHWYYYELHWA